MTTKPTTERPLIDFDRNDLNAALAVWDANAARPLPDPDMTEALVLMFDDPTEFLAALDTPARRRAGRRATARPAR